MNQSSSSFSQHRQASLRRITTAFAIIAIGLSSFRLIQLIMISSCTLGTDIAAYFSGAEHIRHGAPLYSTIIDLDARHIPFVYPPLLAVLFLAFPTYELAVWGWAAFSLVCWLVALGRLLAALRDRLDQRIGRVGWPLLIAGLVTFPALQNHFAWGQAQLLLLLLLVEAWLSIRKERDGCAGLLLGLAVAIKLFPIALALPLVLHRRWRALIAMFSAATVVLVGSFAPFGWATVTDYVMRVLPTAHRMFLGYNPLNCSLDAVLHAIIGGNIATPISLMLRLIIVGAVSIVSYRHPHLPAQAVTFGITMIILILPLVWAHYLVLLYLPWFVALAAASRRQIMLLALSYFLLASNGAVGQVPMLYAIIPQTLPACGTLLLLGVQLQQACQAANATTSASVPRRRAEMSS